MTFLLNGKQSRTLLFVALAFLLNGIGSAQTFTNPLFSAQDPWITYVNGVYYYTMTAYGCPDEHICMKSSTTLTGLSAAPIVDVWSAPSDPTAPNHTDVWAPEIHYLDGNWFIYYAADNGNINNHRLFVLQAVNPSAPTGPYVEAGTGLPHGQLNEVGNHLAIDPDVFTGADGNLYITFSCDNAPTIVLPTGVCLAPMSGPLTISGATSILSTATEPWEKRDTPGIEEGPVGYAWGKDTYITFSASAVGHQNAYDVGVLVHYNDNGTNPDLLTGSWIKYGPILDNHHNSHAPGSVAFVPSVDGSEYWAVYHGEVPCNPYCANIRMQKVLFTSYGFPILGYPVDPGVSLTDPAGEHGAPAGSYTLPDWGNAFGDAAEGNTTSGTIVGAWTLSTSLAGNNTATSSSSGTWNQAFRVWNPNPQDFTFSAQVQWVSDTGIHSDFPKYGVYCSYDDINNHAELFIDKINNVLASHAVVGGVDQGWQNANLPSGFIAAQWHTLQCDKNQSTYTFTLDPGTSSPVSYSRTFNLANGVNGVVTDDTKANFRNAGANQYLTSH